MRIVSRDAIKLLSSLIRESGVTGQNKCSVFGAEKGWYRGNIFALVPCGIEGVFCCREVAKVAK